MAAVLGVLVGAHGVCEGVVSGRVAEQLLEQQPVPHVPQRPPAKPGQDQQSCAQDMRSAREADR